MPFWCSWTLFNTPVLGAAALGVAWGMSLGFVPRTEAPLGTSSGAQSSTRAPVGGSNWGKWALSHHFLPLYVRNSQSKRGVVALGECRVDKGAGEGGWGSVSIQTIFFRNPNDGTQ